MNKVYNFKEDKMVSCLSGIVINIDKRLLVIDTWIKTPNLANNLLEKLSGASLSEASQLAKKFLILNKSRKYEYWFYYCSWQFS